MRVDIKCEVALCVVKDVRNPTHITTNHLYVLAKITTKLDLDNRILMHIVDRLLVLK
jgi:hypothetical protein